MATKTLLTLTRDKAGDISFASGADRRDTIRDLINLLQAGNIGAKTLTSLEVRDTSVAATGTLTISSGTGTVGGTINGVSVTVTWATSDTATATALTTAINASANALVSNHVSATSAAGVVTLTAKIPGHAGNAITLAASGTGVTASGARLTGGTADTLITKTF